MVLTDIYIMTGMAFVCSFGFIVLKIIFNQGMINPYLPQEQETVPVAPPRPSPEAPARFHFVPYEFRTTCNFR